MTAGQWNARVPVGARVRVRSHLGAAASWETSTRSEAWNLGDGSPVVLLVGKTGGWHLDCVEPLDAPGVTP